MKSDRVLAMALALAPLLTLNFSYALSASLEHVPACIPYLSGCTSTSSTGRVYPERFVFLPGMLTSALLIVLFWRRCAARLGPARPAAVLRWLGLLAGLSLAAYTISVGQQDPAFKTMRRLGISSYMLTHYGAQLLLLFAWWRSGLDRKGLAWLAAICLVFPLAGAGGEIAKAVGLTRHAVNNVIEWNAIALVCIYYALTGYYFFSIRPAGRAASPREQSHTPR